MARGARAVQEAAGQSRGGVDVKRHPALAPLSRDHHRALVVARRLREADGESAGEAARRFLEHWRGEEERHFRLEEEVMLEGCGAHLGPGHAAIEHMLREHSQIRADAARLREETPLELLHDLGARLAGHVRFEENELFPLIEAHVPEAELQALGARLAASA